MGDRLTGNVKVEMADNGHPCEDISPKVDRYHPHSPSSFVLLLSP